jgi:hypothetical protein
VQRRMFKPGLCNTPVTHFITGEFLQHFHFSPRVTQHIHEIINDNIQVIVQRLWILFTRSNPAWLLTTLV